MAESKPDYYIYRKPKPVFRKRDDFVIIGSRHGKDNPSFMITIHEGCELVHNVRLNKAEMESLRDHVLDLLDESDF